MFKSITLPFLLSALLLFISCEKIPTEVLDIQTEDYVVKKITAPDIVTYSDAGAQLVTSISIKNKQNIKNIWFDISSADGSTEITTLNKMLNDGKKSVSGDVNANDNIFTGKVTLDDNLLSGKFEISYYVEDNFRIKPENIKKVGTKIFAYQSKAENVAPVISNLNMIDNVNREDKFAFSIVVSDSNGLNDIDLVYYILKDPSGKIIKNSQGISEFPLYDDGAFNHSDDIAGDGIYTTNLSFPNSVSTGDWEFKFIAKDKGGLLSNEIVHKLNVK